MCVHASWLVCSAQELQSDDEDEGRQLTGPAFFLTQASTS